MRRAISAACFVLGVLAATAAGATDPDDSDFAEAVEGAYLLKQADGYYRILTFERSGTVAQVSSQQATIGYTSGAGAWRHTGGNDIAATIVDFTFDLGSGKPSGAARIIITATFSEERSERFQTIVGAFSGQSFAPGQDPLDLAAKPVGTFGVPFTGRRITPPAAR